MGTYEKLVYNNQTGKIELVESERLVWEQVANNFFERIEEYQVKKEEDLKKLEETVYGGLGTPNWGKSSGTLLYRKSNEEEEEEFGTY